MVCENRAIRKRLINKLRLLLSVLFVTAIFYGTTPTGVVLADQTDPVDLPSMTADVYRNLLETGDQLYIFYANIPYDTPLPDALVTEAFMWRLLDTDNTTVIGSTLGTAFHAKGYGYNIFSMYFAASVAPTWDQSYIVRLSGNPTIFDSPPIYDFTLSTGDYSTQTITTVVQSELASRILAIAVDLDTRWSLAIVDSLITEQETGTALSLNGEAFFRGAIFGIQALAPSVFQIVVGTISAVDRTWDPEYAENVSSQYVGTFVGTAQTGGAAMFNKSYDLLSIILLLLLLVSLVIGNLLITRNVWSGLIDVTLTAVLFARIGVPAVLLPFVGLIGAISWVYISGKLWGVIR